LAFGWSTIGWSFTASQSIAIAEQPSSRWRAAGRLILLAAWFLVCIVPHLLTRRHGWSAWSTRFLAGVARICGAEVRLDGQRPKGGDLLLANHVSWLDIPVLAGATGCAFISKAEVRDHPLLNWIADQNATVYIDRADRRGIPDQAKAMRQALERRQPIALFPEGTVGDGGQLLPFKPPLLSAVAPAPEGVTLRPVAIDYGGLAHIFAWAAHEKGMANFFRILGRRGRLPVTIHVLSALPPVSDRKVLAATAQNLIAQTLGLTSPFQSPIGGGE
jgi:1-acyl-sn-glycerol-3-phosphate acyltransferase